MGVGTAELLVVFLIFGTLAFGIVPAIWAAVDAARQPDDAWHMVGMDRATWVLIPVSAALLCAPGGAIAAAFYFLRVRPRLLASD